MALHLSHIARYAPSIQNHIHLKTFAQILTIVIKQRTILKTTISINFLFTLRFFLGISLAFKYKLILKSYIMQNTWSFAIISAGKRAELIAR